MELKWIVKSFDKLGLRELHDLIKLRIDVFVVEQNCPYEELDNMDQVAKHLMGVGKDNEIAAYSRFFAPGVVYPEVSLGRIAVSTSYRGQKIGHALMAESLAQIQYCHGRVSVKISAQVYLARFYESYGFSRISEDYLLDGIPHLDMLMP